MFSMVTSRLQVIDSRILTNAHQLIAVYKAFQRRTLFLCDDGFFRCTTSVNLPILTDFLPCRALCVSFTP